MRVAKCLASLPLIDEAFRTGVISYSKVRAMTRAATPDNQAFLLQVARQGTASHVEKLVRKYEYAKRLSAPREAMAQHEARSLSWYQADDGMLIFQGKLAPEDGALFIKAMNAMMQVMFERDRQAGKDGKNVSAETSATSDPASDPASADTSAIGTTSHLASPVLPEPEKPNLKFVQKRADALVMLAEQAMGSLDREGVLPVLGGDKYQVMVHLETSKIERPEPAATNGDGNIIQDNLTPMAHSPSQHSATPQFDCSLECGARTLPLCPETTRRLSCEAARISVLEDKDGNPLNVGRKTRTIPPAIRRALIRRDKGCRFPGCCESRFVDAHHIHHWCDGGETKMDNLVLLCRHHHRLLHEGGYQVSHGVEDELRFTRPNGTVIESALFPQFPATAAARQAVLAIEVEVETLGLDINETTAICGWHGEQMDYSLAVGVMMDMAERRNDVSAEMSKAQM